MTKNATVTARRQARVRKQLKGSDHGRPRLSVFRSSKQIYVQVIDDVKGVTIAAASSIEKDLRSSLKTGANVDAATQIGKLVAERAKKAGVTCRGLRSWPVSLSRPCQGSCRRRA